MPRVNSLYIGPSRKSPVSFDMRVISVVLGQSAAAGFSKMKYTSNFGMENNACQTDLLN